MHVVVTGGTGFIGRKLVEALARRRDSVAVVSRSTAHHPKVLREASSIVLWSDDQALAAEVARADAVVHLAGANIADKRWTKARVEEIRASRIDTGKKLAECIAASPTKPRVYISASAVGIYGMRQDDAILTEETQPGSDELAQLCFDWELSAQPAVGGCRVAYARTGIVLGKGGGMLERMLPVFRMFAGGSIGTGAQYLSWIHWRDAINGFLFAIDEDVRGPFNLTSPNPVTMDQFAQALGRTLHRPTFMKVPGFALRMAMGDRLANVILTGQRAVPKKLESLGFGFRFTELDAALQDLLVHRLRDSEI